MKKIKLNIENYKNILFLLFLFIFASLYFAYIFKITNDYPWRYVFTDWLINYEAGYIKRGLLGQFSILIFQISNLNFKTIFILQHFLCYLFFLITFYFLTKNFIKNYLFIFFVFSPLVFLYPLLNESALARKEIFFLFLYLSQCFLLTKISNKLIAFIVTTTFVILSCLIHEMSLFFSFFYYFAYYFFLTQKELNINYKEVLISFFLLFFLFWISTRPILPEQVTAMVFYIKNDLGINMTDKSGAISWLTSLNSKISLTNFKNDFNDTPTMLVNISQHFFALHFLLMFCLIIFNYSKFSKKRDFKLFYLITILFPFVLFYVSFSWGRFIYIFYNFNLILFLYIFYQNKEIFIKIDQIYPLSKLNNYTKLFFAIFYCISWKPGIEYFEHFQFFKIFPFMQQTFNYSVKYIGILWSF